MNEMLLRPGYRIFRKNSLKESRVRCLRQEAAGKAVVKTAGVGNSYAR